ncbi:STAS domain-containing protein [Streptomyces sp. NPDC001941]|uniref:STAS domain-containing protein n=1 Tax=Streptomyces sp. NPDC001941 TaxID=3154659 RepID=UPI003328969B
MYLPGPTTPADDHPGYQVTRSVRSGTLTLHLGGEIEWRDMPALRTLLCQAGQAQDRFEVIDLTGLEFADSAFLHLLLDVQRHQRTHGIPMRLAGPLQPIVDRLFTLTGADAYFDFHPRHLPSRP